MSKQLAAGQDPHVQVGEQVTFDFVIRNSGDTIIDVLPMRELFDATYMSYVPGSASATPDTIGPGLLEWDDLTTDIGDLAPGQIATVTATFEAIAHPSSSSTEDTVSVTGALDTYGDPVPFTGDTATVGITEPAVDIAKTRITASPASPGETVTFEVVVTNSGDTTLTTVPVTDDYDDAVLAFDSASIVPEPLVPGALSWTDITTALGDIAPGRSVTFTVDFIALDVNATTTNDALIAAGAAVDEHGDTTGDVSDSDTVRIVRPELGITKSADSLELGPGDTAEYIVEIENSTTVPAAGTVFTDLIPSYLGVPAGVVVEFDGVVAAPGDVAVDTGDPFTVTFARDIAPGQTVTITYELTLLGGTPGGLALENTASVEWFSAGGVGYGPETDTHTVDTLEPVLGVTKAVVGDTELQRGQEASYTITVTNSGDAPAHSLVVTDTLPAGLSYVPGSAVFTESLSGSTWAAEPVVAGQLAIWSLPVTTITPGESLTLVFRAVVDGGSATGTKNNGVAVDGRDGGGGLRGPVSADVDLLVTDPSVAVVKQLADGQDTHIQVGGSVVFDIGITNDGTTDIDVLPLTDIYDPTYLEFVDATPSPDSEAAGSLGWDDLTGAGSLAVGETTTVTVEFTAIAHPEAGSTNDTATVAGAIDEHGDPTAVARDTASIAITAPSVEVSKVFSGTERSVYQLGTPVSFDIRVRNTGDTTITELPLTDIYDPAVLEFVSAQPAIDTTGTGTVGWSDITATTGDLAPGQSTTLTLTFRAIGAGESSNRALVENEAGTDEFGDPVRGDRDTRPFGVYDPAQVTLAKTADPPAGTIVLPGDTLTYFVSFENTSTFAIPSVVLTDVLPDSVTYRAGTLKLDRGDGALVALTDASDGDEGAFGPSDGPQGTVRASLDQVPARTTVTLSFQVVVGPAELSRAGVRNYASVTSAGDAVATAGPVDHPVDPFDIEKTGRDVNGGRLMAGDRIEWTIVVRNTGLTRTTNVVVKDTVPSQTTYVADSIEGRGADDSGAPRLVWNVGTMEIGESVTLTFRSRVKSGLASGTRIRNQAVVTADQSAPKYSDSPTTAEVGDPTLLQTGANDWVWLAGVLALLFAAAVAWSYSRRLRRA